MYDFGYAGLGKKVRHTFNIKNIGSETVVISEVNTDCGCTAALLSGMEIKPGGIGTVHATFETKKYEGKQEKNIIISSNDPEEPEIVLTIKGTIKRCTALVPQGVNLGDVTKGETATGKVRLLQLSDERLVVHKIDVSEFLTAHAVHFRDENSNGYEVEISLSGDAPTGPFTDIVTLHTNLKKRPRIDVPVWANIVEPQMNTDGRR